MARNDETAGARHVWLEVLLVWAAGLLVLLASGLAAGVGGVVGRNLGTLVAAYFLLVPILLLRRRGMDPADFGISLERPFAALGWALAAAAVVFPPYVAGYEVWARLTRGAALSIPEHPLSHFPSEARDRPPLPGVPGLHAWFEAERLWVLNTGTEPATVEVAGCACPPRALALSDGDLFFASRTLSCEAGDIGPVTLAHRQGFCCQVSASRRVSVATMDPPVPVLVGAGSVESVPGRADFERSVLWLPELLLVQFAAIALPEEAFYRGYVQTRLRRFFRRRRFLGAEVGAEVLLASGLFALSHLVAVQAPFRLAVFFPGLMFGWLRERSGSVLAPACLHAMCNVLLEVLVRYHS